MIWDLETYDTTTGETIATYDGRRGVTLRHALLSLHSVVAGSRAGAGGLVAIRLAERHSAQLRAYADPTGAIDREVMVDEAREIAEEDPALVYLPLPVSATWWGVRVTPAEWYAVSFDGLGGQVGGAGVWGLGASPEAALADARHRVEQHYPYSAGLMMDAMHLTAHCGPPRAPRVLGPVQQIIERQVAPLRG